MVTKATYRKLASLEATKEKMDDALGEARLAYDEKRKTNDEQVKNLRTKLATELKVLSERKDRVEKDLYEVRREIQNLSKEIREAKAPFEEKDIVRDENDVKYRVTSCIATTIDPEDETYTAYGIRLTKSGAEAYRDPRLIRSDKLTLVEA